ncbi:SusC/RagA family TonB-linked outer membrane protein [Dinghuibacter silviterrae]|uniref:TonB-linked SusC/RagA family outer membrane protein n=1 Tax=Dinghuibacter silviterrae TaxID=1539049 RepID=A0A4R8DXW4_9BACT|nr:TonB-dependent receptor [Dinghuibacter silviterrae]TDX02405.1 TonB-linked SusC/RagA family outer membrane protein [Dinghuibacter silviterrae]
MRRKLLLPLCMLLLCFLCLYTAHAQTKTVTGTVSDDKGTTLPGATVTVQSTKISTKTDVNGRFTLSVPAGAKSLIVTFVGMKAAEVSIGSKANVDVTLTSLTATLSDVVVIGYGVQKKSDVNGAISSIKATDIADIPQPSIDQMMQGKAAGVTVTQNSGMPGAAVSVHVRGITSFTGSEPLYVIDGVAIDGNSANNGHQLTSPASPSQQESSPSPLAMLNPSDIESIDVLKDASATAIYGSRGSNGVVIITTKKGKAGTGKITYDGYYGKQEQGKFLNMMSLPQYASLENNMADLFGLPRRAEFANPGKLGPGTDWQKAIFRRAPQTSHNLAFSGSNGKTDFYISGGYFDQDGTVIASDFKRYSVHTTVNSQINNWFKAGTSFSASQSSSDIGLGNSYGIIYTALLQAPDAAVYNADGSYAGPAVVNGQVLGYRNPVQEAYNITNTLGRSNAQGNVYGDIKFPLDITLHSEIDGNFDWSNAKTFLPTYSYGATGSQPAFVNTQASLNEYNAWDNYWNWIEHLNYNHTFGKHAITALVGHEVWESTYGGIQAGTKGFTAGNTIQTLGLGTQANNTLGEPKGSSVMESFIGRLIYTYDNKYSITATERRDRSSNFAQGHQVGYFPGVAVSWRLSEESFMNTINPIVSNLKIRTGYGTTGNSNTGGGYKYGSAIQPVVTGLGTGFSVYNFNNPNLTWETAIQKNLGVDFSLLHGRVDATFDVYDKTSKNFLFQQPLPAFLSGGTAEYSNAAIVQPPWVNAGKIENKGFEFSITSHNLQTRNFRWNTTLIFSHYKNKVISLNGFPSLIGNISTGFGPQIPATVTQVGGPVGEFFGYKTAGIIKTQAQLTDLAQNPQNVAGVAETVTSDRTNNTGVYLGDILYAGRNVKGAANTQYALGNPNPNFTYSLSNDFTYKGFELSVFLTGSQGGKILNALAFQTEGLYGLYMNQTAAMANYWTPSNPNSNIPTPRSGWGNNNLVMSDRFLENASFLRLQNVRFGYNLPSEWAKYVKMSHLKAYVSGQNLHVWTKYSGLDPEVGSLNQNPLLQNIDYGRYPVPRVITVGINAEF